MIRQLTASVLKFNDQMKISMRSIISSHEIWTIELKYLNEEVAKIQWVYRMHLRLISSFPEKTFVNQLFLKIQRCFQEMNILRRISI
jgi:hypothetical protein